MADDARRNERRVMVDREVSLQLADGQSVSARLLDLSSGGFRLGQLSEELVTGEAVSMTIGRELLQGRIRWVLGEEAGGDFLSPPPELD